jgi:hypothetical protein
MFKFFALLRIKRGYFRTAPGALKPFVGLFISHPCYFLETFPASLTGVSELLRNDFALGFPVGPSRVEIGASREVVARIVDILFVFG